jgi:hypothetical protein
VVGRALNLLHVDKQFHESVLFVNRREAGLQLLGGFVKDAQPLKDALGESGEALRDLVTDSIRICLAS